MNSPKIAPSAKQKNGHSSTSSHSASALSLSLYLVAILIYRDSRHTDAADKFTSYEPYKFTGKEEDKEVGLFYFGARYYSAYLGRWLSPDPPVTHGIGVGNQYNYGANNPYNFVDPDGNSPSSYNGHFNTKPPAKGN
jgi:RHS repeat-associated protein